MKTVNRVLKRAKELSISWPLDTNDTDAVLAEKLFPSAKQVTSTKRMPDFEYIRKELFRHGVSKKLLWTEYMGNGRARGVMSNFVEQSDKVCPFFLRQLMV